MTYPQAIVVSVALIAAATIFTNIAPPAEAQRGGRWQMQTTSLPAYAWRINNTTGVMQACYGVPRGVTASRGVKPVCITMPNP